MWPHTKEEWEEKASSLHLRNPRSSRGVKRVTGSNIVILVAILERCYANKKRIENLGKRYSGKNGWEHIVRSRKIQGQCQSAPE